MYAQITKDLLDLGDVLPDFKKRDGWVVIGRQEDRPSDDKLITCRLLDDDREVYYHAVADDEALEYLFYWGMRDSGCAILETLGEGGWRDCIS